MACQDISHSWTFSGLVGAFLDLAIAYFLLCCSAVTFSVTKFLSFFGFSLHCPCNGLFGFPYRGPCLQKLLLDCPAETVSSVQFYVKSKFPFDAILARSDHCQLNLKLVRERRLDDGRLELEAEASYSSSSDPRRSQQSLSGSDSIGKIDFKGKGTANQRQRYGLRPRRRGSIDYGKFTSTSSYDHMESDVNVRVLRRSPSEPSKIGSELTSQKLMPVNLPVQDPSTVPRRIVPDVEPTDSNDENKLVYKSATSLENLKNNLGGQDENAVRILEHALEEEQAARAALCSELEQERIAAATAADEAMAMISRLQEEKASIEIEARQYQRILEEKSAYDAEEMNILKEIIVMREREKHFLEKEAEAYRKVLQDSEGLTSQVSDTQQNDAFVLDSSVDPMLMLQQLSESLDKRGSLQDKSNCLDYASGSVEKQTCTESVSEQSSVMEFDDKAKIAEGIDSPDYSSIVQDHLQNGDESSQDIQEKGMLSIDEIKCPQLRRSSSSPNRGFQGKSTIVGEIEQNDNVYLLQNVVPGVKNIEDGEVVKMGASEPHVHDVHIIDSKRDICDKSAIKRGDPLLIPSNASNVSRKFELQLEASNIQRVDESANNSLRAELDIGRSRSDIVHSFSSVSSSPSRSFLSEVRRNSLSAVDHERLRIDSEIGWLRERLRAVQEEKEKLKNSLERRERGRSELQLLEDIATQVREIRHLTEPEKASRALPPLSSKVTSKKRRSRSISGGVCQSAST